MIRYSFLYLLLSYALIGDLSMGTTSLPPGKYMIDDVCVVDKEGNDLPQKEATLIQKIAQLYAGKKIVIPTKVFKEVMESSLWERGYAVEIKAKKKKEGEGEGSFHLRIQIKILAYYPPIRTVSWRGFSLEEKKKLEELTDLIKGKPFLFHLKKIKKERIENFLRKKGYARVKISLYVFRDEKAIDLEISIDKKELYRLGHITFKKEKKSYKLTQYLTYSRKGTLSIHNGWYQRIFQDLTQQNFLLALEDMVRPLKFNSPLFIEEELNKDIEKLEEVYRGKGYLDARASYDLSYKKGFVDINFNFDRGSQYRIGSIRWVGNGWLSEEELNEGLGLCLGEVYNPFEIEGLCIALPEKKNIHALYESYQAPVFVSAKIVLTGIKNGKVSLEGRIIERPFPDIVRVEMHMGEKMRKHVGKMILAEYGVVKGEKLTPKKIRACHQGLFESGLFIPETIELIPSEEGSNKVKVDCYLLERTNSSYSIGMEEGSFQLVFGEKNFDIRKLFKGSFPFGGGEQVDLQMSIENMNAIYLGFSFTDPFFSYQGHRLPIGIKVGKEPKGKGGYLTLHVTQFKKVPYPYQLSYSLGCKRQELKGHYSRQMKLADTCSFKIHFSRDQTNDLFYPTLGSSYQALVKGTQLLKEDSPWLPYYLQLMGQYSYFTTLKPYPLTFGYTLTAGFSPTASEKSPLGRFILGDNLFMVAKSNLLQPSLIPFRGVEKVSSFLEGGESPFYLSQSAELRYRFLKRPLVYGLLFCDHATRGSTSLATLGAEVRVNTPLGMISLYTTFLATHGKPGIYLRLLHSNRLY